MESLPPIVFLYCIPVVPYLQVPQYRVLVELFVLSTVIIPDGYFYIHFHKYHLVNIGSLQLRIGHFQC